MASKISIVAGILLISATSLFLLAGESSSGTGRSSATASRPTSTSSPAVTEADFLKVMKDRSCVRCHPTCKSVADLKARNWLNPGQPEKSAIFTVLGKAKKGGKYHDVSQAEAIIIHDFIAGLK